MNNIFRSAKYAIVHLPFTKVFTIIDRSGDGQEDKEFIDEEEAKFYLKWMNNGLSYDTICQIIDDVIMVERITPKEASIRGRKENTLYWLKNAILDLHKARQKLDQIKSANLKVTGLMRDKISYIIQVLQDRTSIIEQQEKGDK